MHSRIDPLYRHPKITSFVAGALATLGFAPYGLFPLTLAALAVFYSLVMHTSQGFKLGYCFGLGFFGFALYWVNYAMLVDVERFWWIIPIGLTTIPAAAALLTAFSTWGFSRVSDYFKPWAQPVIFSVIWTTTEWICGHYILNGMPWCLLGYTCSSLLPLCQLASVTGVYGLSFLICLLGTYGGDLLHQWRRRPPIKMLHGFWGLLGISLLITSWGAYRLHCHPTELHDFTVRLVQPNIDQARKWNFEEIPQVFREHMTLSHTRTSQTPVQLVILPESAISHSPKFLDQDLDRRTYMASFLQEGSWIIAGTSRFASSVSGGDIYNGLLAIDHTGTVCASFDKFHLLPFGEYLPLGSFLASIAPGLFHKVTAGEKDFTPGPGPRTITLGTLPSFSPLICYEVVFPHGVTQKNAPRPQWLLNITNDGWFRDSIGPYQHFAIARMRTIEEGLPLARVANTGISAMVDPCGRILHQLPLETAGVIDAKLAKTIKGTTSYTLWGDGFLFLGFLLSLLVTLIFGRVLSFKHKRSKP